MKDNLKSCPFCGGEATEDTQDSDKSFKEWYVRCIHCLAETYGYYDSKQEAIKAWNTRLNSEFKQETEEALLFVDHIKEHLYEPFLDVKCKICDKTMNEITGGTYGRK